MIAATSAASTTHITAGSSVTRSDGDQFAAARLRHTEASTANATAPAASQTDSPARLGSHTLHSGLPACNGTRASPGSRTTAYPAATIIPASSSPPTTSDAINVPSRPAPWFYAIPGHPGREGYLGLAGCDMHHVELWSDGGRTSVDAIKLICRFHHQVMIHRYGWKIIAYPDGTTEAISPHGEVLRSHGPPPAKAG